MTATALIFFTGAIPYIIGRWLGGRAAEERLVNKALEESTEFELWLARKKAALAGKKIGEISSTLGIS
jgi:hypothetical protein